MKAGDKVKLKGRTGLSGYGFYPRIINHLKKHKTLTIRRVKSSGGILFEDFEIGENMFGEEQGLKPRHLILIKSKRKPKKNKK